MHALVLTGAMEGRNSLRHRRGASLFAVRHHGGLHARRHAMHDAFTALGA